MYRLIRISVYLFLIGGLASCGQILVGIEDQSTPIQPGVEPTTKVESTIPAATASPTAEPSPYWDVVEDGRTGLRFAMPCFWEADIPGPELDPSGRGAFSVRNYDDQYAMSFPRSQIPEDAGKVKIDMLLWETSDFGAAPGASLSDLKIDQFFAGSDSEIGSTEMIELNGQDALHVTSQSTFGIGQIYLMKLTDTLVLGVSPVFPTHNPDVGRILDSIALDPGTAVKIPVDTPAPPPVGIAAPCVPEYATAVEPTQALTEENTDCGVHSFRSLEYLIAKVEDYLQARNTGGLVYEYLVNDPFVIGYWGSEGVTLTPQEAFGVFANSLYRAAEPGGMTFTTDRSAFPPLSGMPPDSMFGPDLEIAQIVFSEGWGLDGQGAALLYFTQDDCGGYYWYGLVFSQEGFRE